MNTSAINSFIDKPVFICGHRKTGTTLLINLLDGHPNLAVFPDDSGFFYMYYPLFDKESFSKDQKIEAITEKIIGNLETSIMKTPQESQASLIQRLPKLREAFAAQAEKTSCTPKDMLQCLLQTYHEIYQVASDPKGWVEKTTSTEIYATDVIKWFPSAKFVHIIRDPRDNWASMKSGWDKRYKLFNESERALLQTLIDRGKLGMEFAKANQELFTEEQYLVIKFEDLTGNPEETMKKVCRFIGVPYHEIVMQPTVCKQPWGGNNFENIKFRSVSGVNVNKWKERITKEEAQLIEYHFSSIMDHFGYKKEYSLNDQVEAAKQHYKWHNFSQKNSYKPTI